MKLKFKIQQYQTDAVEAVVSVFNGQPNQGLLDYKIDKGRVYIQSGSQRVVQTTLEAEDESTGYRNGEVVLDEPTLLANIHHTQTANNIHLSSNVAKKLGHCQLDVEMETGTGKTYVYIKTMFELNARFGWTKFIVVVPSVAIREGVKKSFDITVDHFMEHYGKKAHYFVYNSDNLTQIDNFSKSADINVMIINTQAFNSSLKEGAKNKAARIIYDERDNFGSRKPIEVIAANRPIIILDEPQKMGGTATQTALAHFKPLFTLNYSATHKETHNPVYVLDALDAYNQKLVKKIEVVGFDLKNLKGTDGYLYLQEIVLSKNKAPQAKIEMEVQHKTGNIKRETKLLQQGDDLYSLSGNMEQYKGLVITDIEVDTLNPAMSGVAFSNGDMMRIKEVVGNITADHKARIQIRETIRAHFRKEKQLFRHGIKCLSLFFLDEVANYRQYDEEGHQQLGRYGEIFEQEYMAELNNNMDLNLDMFNPKYKEYLSSIAVRNTHAGYFSIDKKGHSVNSEVKRGTEVSDDISAYDLILKNKERLLSFDEPVRFIFSHSALREGWDNPNVFQICSLRQSGSIAQKRQEVGRGLRLCVDAHGVRQDHDTVPNEVHQINLLTVIASEGYASFVDALQKDIRADLYDRPSKADVKFFVGKVLTAADGSKHTMQENEALEAYFQLRTNGYIDHSGEIQPKFHEDLQKGELIPFKDKLQPFTEQLYKRVQGIFDPNALNNMVDNGNKPETPKNELNNNFHKKEFQELWRRINHKYAYVVNFDSKELIEKAKKHINAQLTVSKLNYVVTRGEQKATLTSDDMQHDSMTETKNTETMTLKTDVVTHVKYDLLGKIAAATKLTRRTVADILSEIEPKKFAMYKMNPEEFIQKVTRLIKEQKATIIVQKISYNRIDGTFDSDIFTQEKHTTVDKAFQGKKSIMDYVFTDGTAKQSIERKFVEQLDTAKEVVVYAKLPKGFYIPTPVGNYSPDWAIAFQEGEVKHVYFVAETKGSMSSMDLREIESTKIACAEKLFEQMSSEDVKYGKVDSYEALMSIVK